jgi:P27 family predicted phage terminase small subunit
VTKRPRPAWMRVTPPKRGRVPSVPRGLTGYGRDAWHRVAPVLWRAGILTRLDLVALEGLCRCWGHWRACMDHMSAEPGTGPLEESAREWRKVTCDYMADFFLTPRSRVEAFDRDPLEAVVPNRSA